MRWGIVGHGKIATYFLDAAQGLGHEIGAVVGRDALRVETFAAEHQIGCASLSPIDLVGEVDVAYVATPHSSHCHLSRVLLAAGVPVLCEKPMAVNALQARQMVESAQASETFLMEAMWTRHLPVYGHFWQWIEEGRIGAVQKVEADFGFDVPYDPAGRLWAPELAGGSLLDVGIYPLVLAGMAFGSQPVSFDAEAELSPDGVDTRVSVLARYVNGGLAKLRSAINTYLEPRARVIGSEGLIEIPEFWRAERISLKSLKGEKVDEIYQPHRFNGFEYQITEVERCLTAGALESPVVAWPWSIEMAELMDGIRAQIGVVYPCDEGQL